MPVYKNKAFNRWAAKEGIDDSKLCAAVDEMAAGLYDADLGGGLLKKRLARQGRGKSGGYRTIVVTNKNDRWIFVYGFPKNARSTIDPDEEKALKKLASSLLSLSERDIEKAKNTGAIIEVNRDEESEVTHPCGST